MHIRPFHIDDEPEVIALWEQCDLIRPWNDSHKDIQRKLRVGGEMFLVGTIDGRVIASVMAGYEGHRGWLNYLAVALEHRGRGYARRLVAAAEALLREAGCPKINLQVRTSNAGVIEFYQRIGYTIDDVVSLGKRLESDTPSAEGTKRPATSEEIALIRRLVEADFPGAVELRQQLALAQVTYSEWNQVPFLLCRVPNSAPNAPVTKRVPVEAEFADLDGVVIHLLVHVVSGRLEELEVFREDGGQILCIPPASALVPMVFG